MILNNFIQIKKNITNSKCFFNIHNDLTIEMNYRLLNFYIATITHYLKDEIVIIQKHYIINTIYLQNISYSVYSINYIFKFNKLIDIQIIYNLYNLNCILELDIFCNVISIYKSNIYDRYFLNTRFVEDLLIDIFINFINTSDSFNIKPTNTLSLINFSNIKKKLLISDTNINYYFNKQLTNKNMIMYNTLKLVNNVFNVDNDTLSLITILPYNYIYISKDNIVLENPYFDKSIISDTNTINTIISKIKLNNIVSIEKDFNNIIKITFSNYQCYFDPIMLPVLLALSDFKNTSLFGNSI